MTFVFGLFAKIAKQIRHYIDSRFFFNAVAPAGAHALL